MTTDVERRLHAEINGPVVDFSRVTAVVWKDPRTGEVMVFEPEDVSFVMAPDPGGTP